MIAKGYMLKRMREPEKKEGPSKHPVHFWPKKSSAMRRVLVPNLSATFHAPRTKFIYDLKVSAAPVIRLR